MYVLHSACVRGVHVCAAQCMCDGCTMYVLSLLGQKI